MTDARAHESKILSAAGDAASRPPQEPRTDPPVGAPRAAQEEERGWVIERHIAGRLHYWTGRPDQRPFSSSWSDKPEDAVRFARYTDAELMLTYHCNGIGNVVEHLWMPLPAPPEAR